MNREADGGAELSLGGGDLVAVSLALNESITGSACSCAGSWNEDDIAGEEELDDFCNIASRLLKRSIIG